MANEIKNIIEGRAPPDKLRVTLNLDNTITEYYYENGVDQIKHVIFDKPFDINDLIEDGYLFCHGCYRVTIATNEKFKCYLLNCRKRYCHSCYKKDIFIPKCIKCSKIYCVQCMRHCGCRGCGCFVCKYCREEHDINSGNHSCQFKCCIHRWFILMGKPCFFHTDENGELQLKSINEGKK